MSSQHQLELPEQQLKCASLPPLLTVMLHKSQVKNCLFLRVFMFFFTFKGSERSREAPAESGRHQSGFKGGEIQ